MIKSICCLPPPLVSNVSATAVAGNSQRSRYLIIGRTGMRVFTPDQFNLFVLFFLALPHPASAFLAWSGKRKYARRWWLSTKPLLAVSSFFLPAHGLKNTFSASVVSIPLLCLHWQDGVRHHIAVQIFSPIFRQNPQRQISAFSSSYRSLHNSENNWPLPPNDTGCVHRPNDAHIARRVPVAIAQAVSVNEQRDSLMQAIAAL